MMGHNPRVGSL